MERYKRSITGKIKNHMRLMFIAVFENVVKSKKLDKRKDICYIIRRDGHGAGFFSNYLWVLSHVMYAEDNGMIPVVDMKHYPTLYSENRAVNGTKNAWNYYFEDVSKYSLHEAYSSKNFVLGDYIYHREYVKKYCGKYGLPTPEAVAYLFPIIDKHMIIRTDILNMMESDRLSLLYRWGGTENDVIAVHYRGTDMKRTDLNMHYQPADVDDYIDAVQQIIDEIGIKRVFLATDEEGVLERFKDKFGKDVITYDAFRADQEDELIGLHDSAITRKDHKYLLGYEVLRDAYTLSKGEALVCGYSNVSNVAILWNNNRYKRIIVVER